MKLTYLRLLVSDFDASFRFYRDVMGFIVGWGEEGAGYADFSTGSDTGLALFDRAEMSRSLRTAHLPAAAEAQDHFLLIFGVEDLDVAIAHLRERGATIAIDPTDHPDWGIRTAHIRDPDGNLIEINSPMPHEEWSDDLKAANEKYE
jgi:catechol 2,3-dioxygenase-like lactoylglutathione lyase family enzyme